MGTNLVCYGYADSTHEYTGPTVGDFDPMDEGNVLWPRNTTQVAPPSFTAGNIPVYDENTKKWTVLPDFRGKYGYDPDGNMVLITKAGNPSTFIPPLTTTPPTPEEPELPPVDENYAKRTSKVAFFRRSTDSEAAQFMADLAEASPRLKAIFDSVVYLIPGTDEYPNLRGAVEARVGVERANELLAPSND